MSGKKDEREVGVVTMRAVTVPVRRGKNVLSIRFQDFEEAVRLAKDGGAKLLFDIPGDSEATDLGVTVADARLEAAPAPVAEKAEKTDSGAKSGTGHAGIPEKE